ncbi:MAG TPA: cobalt chelatase [Syntrophaceae bacterium]|nr:cobalt chelatase [Syntrophaceae bacterium]HCX01456.1 cobalt chelatase [Syntrophaceae bacterium]
MYRNRLKPMRQICILIVGFLLVLLMYPGMVQAETIKVSLLLGDQHSRMAIDIVKSIGSSLSEKGQSVADIRFFVYPEKDVRRQDLTHLRESQLIIVFIMGRQLLNTVKPEIEEALKNGARVYGVGGFYDNELKKMGLLFDRKMNGYFTTGTPGNIKNLVLYALQKEFLANLSVEEPVILSETGVYDRKTKKVFTDFTSYRAACLSQSTPVEKSERPWIGVIFHRNSIEAGQTKTVDYVIDALERQGFNVLAVYGSVYNQEAAESIILAPPPRSVRLIVAIGWKVGVNPETSIPFLRRLGVPVIDAITLKSQSEKEWRQSPVGLDIFERAWQVGNPEMAGIIQPTVIASKEKRLDRETGMEYVEDVPIPERVNRLAQRVSAWVRLQDTPNRQKKIALIHYSYPPGKQNIGASYLNVLPQSLYEIANRMTREGYDFGDLRLDNETPEQIKAKLFADISGYARNIGNWAPAELDRLALSGFPVLISLDDYKKWFADLPQGFQKAVIKSWGPVEQSKIMIWTGPRGKKYLVLPAMRYGNIIFTPQPSRGWEQDEKKLFHDVTLAPHHQYVAFYLWLKYGFGADAVVHVGTHGTHEWLSGKEIGFTDEDPSEVLIRDLPNIYPYIVDNVGEGTQAKRRGLAVIIDHMTPPFDQAGLNRELKELAALINDYGAAREKSPALAESKRVEINSVAEKMGLLADLKMSSIKAEADIEEVEHYIKEIMEKQTPFGLHTFGRAPDEKYRQSTAQAIVSIEKDLTEAERQAKKAEMEGRMVLSAKKELDALMAALDGKYVPAGRGNDPIRNPDSLPTGRNFYSFDPTRIPAKSTYEMGAALARDFIEGYRKRHNIYPDKITFNIWAVETMRHEGVMESQIMHLLGVRPQWDARGRVTGVEIIPRSELGRPRIDVTMVPSGLYRDLFSNLMALLDGAVSLSGKVQEEDNAIRININRTRQMLLQKGVDEEKAGRLAAVRIFTVPSGAYGTNLDKVIPMSNTWENEGQVADVYFLRMSNLYGQGFWGNSEEQGGEDISRMLLKNALSGSKAAIHSRSTNLYATLDNDDFFQYLGGTAMAIRVIDGKTPEVYVTNMSNPKVPKQETLERVMGREMRSRYLNPEWIKAMMKEGYAGARFIDKVVEHLWGWQVTVPEAVDAAKWNEMYETYVLDRNGLDIKQMFREAKNMYAYQSLVARMLEAVRKSYWKPDAEVEETLAREYAKSVQEVGLACCDHTCNNPLLTQYTSSTLLSIPGLRPLEQGFMKALDAMKQPERTQAQARSGQTGQQEKPAAPMTGRAPDGKKTAEAKTKIIDGFEMKEAGTAAGASSAPIPWLFMLGFLVFIGLIAFGFRKR